LDGGTDTLLASKVAEITAPEAARILMELFEIEGALSPLSSERDRNFLVRTGRGSFVLKFTNPSEDPAIINFQTEALLHLKRAAPALPVPRLIQSTSGLYENSVSVAGGTWTVRLMTFLAGSPLDGTETSESLLREMGRTLAAVDIGLRDFKHPASDHDLLWDISKAARARSLFRHIEDADQKRLVNLALDGFQERAEPKLPQLRWQVIHNDLNPQNIVSDGNRDSFRITGIIDFGDMIRAPLINELATSIAYLSLDAEDPLSTVTEVVASYHQALPLRSDEIGILLDLICARQILIVAITNWRAQLHPDNRTYILRNSHRVWRSLSTLTPLSRARAGDVLMKRCGDI